MLKIVCFLKNTFWKVKRPIKYSFFHSFFIDHVYRDAVCLDNSKLSCYIPGKNVNLSSWEYGDYKNWKYDKTST